MARKTPPSTSRVEPGKAKERQCTGPNCERMFAPRTSQHSVCSPRCEIAKRKAAAKAERESDKARAEKLKTITEWEQECKAIVQKIARIRDRHDGCISCHMGPHYTGRWQGSHFRPAGNHSAVELHLWNIHKSCAQCNLKKHGNTGAYRPRLVEKIGRERVEWLESQNQVTKRTVDYLKRFKRVMGKRLRRLEKRAKA